MEDLKQEKKLKAIPIEDFRIHIYRASIEDFIHRNYHNGELTINKYDAFFDNLDQQSFCKALACAVYQYRECEGIAFFNRLWAKKLIAMGAPKDPEYAARVPAEALEKFLTYVRKRYEW